MRLTSFIAMLIYGVCQTAAQAATTTFTIYGDRGDAGAHDECPAGQYLVGVIGNTGDWVDQITVICAKPGSDLTFSGRRSIASRGGGTGAYTEAYCNADEAVSGAYYDRNKGYEIVTVVMSCRSIRTGVTRTRALVYGNGPYWVSSPPQDCPPNQLATGFNIRYGKYVNGLGLICEDFIAPVAANPHPVTPTPVPEKFVKVLLSDDVYDQPDPPKNDKPKGTLPKDTTGVMLIKKGPDNWYQLSWPGNPPGENWVYSAADYLALDPASLQ